MEAFSLKSAIAKGIPELVSYTNYTQFTLPVFFPFNLF